MLPRMRVRMVTTILTAIAAFGLLLASPSASALEEDSADTDSWGGNYLQQRIWYDLKAGCYDGKTGYKMKRTTFTFYRADSQFSAKFVKGRFGVAAMRCNAGDGAFSRNKSFDAPDWLSSGNTYTRYYGTPSEWVVLTAAGYVELFQSYVVLDLHRGSVGHVAYLCTHAKVAAPGDACGDYN